MSLKIPNHNPIFKSRSQEVALLLLLINFVLCTVLWCLHSYIMACREHQEDKEVYDYLNRLEYDVGSLLFQFRNNKNCMMSEFFFTSPDVESKVTETLHSRSEDDKPESLESEPFNPSLADRILTDVIHQCKFPVDRGFLCSEYLRELEKVEADLVKKMDEMCHRYEESFSQIIHSSKL